ncbi:hypothetical protein D9615_007776 [Tricholomella constricta]|uniref:non-chaperonin molecular chaperone ATPase n=1 Tax=Tricholomella constricta TaxID=117010 RepID=A0A8H5M0A1_9AGAR|nr:hypothetical protein D9615_007776 [Tricholomella constricta]
MKHFPFSVFSKQGKPYICVEYRGKQKEFVPQDQGDRRIVPRHHHQQRCHHTTSGSLSVVPTSAISTPPPAVPRSTMPTPATYAHPHMLYRLSAVVCHYDQHSFGHHICYRHKPCSHLPWAPPRLAGPLQPQSAEDDDDAAPQYRWVDEDGSSRSRPGRGWLPISDDAVRECGIETVLQEGAGAFMLYYKRAVLPQAGMYAGRMAGNGSEETLKPEMCAVDLNGSVGSLISEVGFGVLNREGEEGEKGGVNGNGVAMNGSAHGNGNGNVGAGVGLGVGSVGSVGSVPAPRIVRSVAAGRRRSLSVTPSGRELSPMSMSLDRLIPVKAAAPAVLQAIEEPASEASRVQFNSESKVRIEPYLTKTIHAGFQALHNPDFCALALPPPSPSSAAESSHMEEV